MRNNAQILLIRIWSLCMGAILIMILGSRLRQAESTVSYWASDDTHRIRYVMDLRTGIHVDVEAVPKIGLELPGGQLLYPEVTHWATMTLSIIDNGRVIRDFGEYRMYPGSINWVPDTDTVFLVDVLLDYANLYHIDLESGKQTLLQRFRRDSWHITYSPDQRHVTVRGSPNRIANSAVVDILSGETFEFGKAFDLRWSPDSQYIVYVDHNAPRSIALVDVVNGRTFGFDETQLQLRIPENLEVVYTPIWSSDGQRLLISLIDANETWGLYALNPFSGDLDHILNAELIPHSWSPDERYLIAREIQPERGYRYYLIEQETGAKTPLFNDGVVSLSGEVVWSPDSAQVAFDTRILQENTRTFTIFDTQTGSTRYRYSIPYRDFPPPATDSKPVPSGWWSDF